MNNVNVRTLYSSNSCVQPESVFFTCLVEVYGVDLHVTRSNRRKCVTANRMPGCNLLGNTCRLATNSRTQRLYPSRTVYLLIYIYLGVMSDTTNVLLFSWNRKPLQHRCLYCECQHNVGNYTFERGKIEEGVQFDMHCT